MYFGGAEHRLTSLQLAIADFPTLQLGNSQTALKSVADAVFANGDKQNYLPVEAFNVYNKTLAGAISDVSSEQSKMLYNNMSRFAAAKTAVLVNRLDEQRADINGVVRTKAEYDVAAKKVINEQNRFITVEYNTAVHRFRVAKQWSTFQAEKHLYPNIEWLRTRSAEPRNQHLDYVGRVWSMDDDFFINNQPGCLYECKCSWKTTDAPVTDNKDVKITAPDLGLEGNPYYTNEIYTDKHPYFSKCIDLNQPSIPARGVLHNPDEIVYINQTTPGKNSYQIHYNELVIDPKNKQAANTLLSHKKIAEMLVDSGEVKELQLLPNIRWNEKALRERYYGKSYNDAFPTKCPDCKADGMILEFKLSSLKNFASNVKEGGKQSNIVVIKLEADLSYDAVKSLCEKQFSKPERKNIKKIIVATKNDVYSFKNE